jgi:hypothetical protein
MAFLICAVPVSPVRAEASHRSEQVSQLLFGEGCEVLETAKDFVRVKCLYDNYEGWCQANQLEEVSASFGEFENKVLAGDWVNGLTINNKIMRIPFASDLSFLYSADGLIGKNRIVYEGTTIEPGVKMTGDNRIREAAFTFLNTPYQWGGRSVFGVDCSGFTQVVYKCIGLKLLRDASQQATQGEVVGFLQEVKCGDLAFFDNEAGKITHVGILLDLHTIIHASGKVRVDRIDNFGIVNSDTEKRTHTLRVIKRIGE